MEPFKVKLYRLWSLMQLQAFPHEYHWSLFTYANQTSIDQAAERIIIKKSLAHSPSQQCVIDKCVLKTNTAGEGIENIESEPALYSLLLSNILRMIWREWRMLKIYIYNKQIKERERVQRKKKRQTSLHLSTSDDAVGHWVSWKLSSSHGAFLAAFSFHELWIVIAGRFLAPGLRRFWVLLFSVLGLRSGGVAVFLANWPCDEDPRWCCWGPFSVPLMAEVESISRNWEAEPKRSSSSVSAASCRRGEKVPLRLLQDSQQSLL